VFGGAGTDFVEGFAGLEEIFEDEELAAFLLGFAKDVAPDFHRDDFEELGFEFFLGFFVCCVDVHLLDV